jgi:nitrogen fixation NifU-like protein
MTSELQELYQQVILDHHRKPRNFRRLDQATQQAEGVNPLCGDAMRVELRVEDGVIRDIAFQGTGCAISRASASMMTAHLQGKSVTAAQEAFGRFHGMVTGAPEPAEGTGALDKLTVFAGVREFPSRIKCATLPWHTLRAALAVQAEPVTTE